MKYKLQINAANAAIGSSCTVTANEVVEPLSSKELAREIHHANALIPEDVARSVIDNFAEVAAQKMAQGYSIHLKKGDDVMLRIYADIHLADTFDLAKLRSRGYTGSEITEEAFKYIYASDLTVRARAEAEKKFTKLITDEEVGFHRTNITTATADQTSDDDNSEGGNEGNEGEDNLNEDA